MPGKLTSYPVMAQCSGSNSVLFVRRLESGIQDKGLTPRVGEILHHLSNLTAVRDTESDKLSQCDESTTSARTESHRS